MIKKKTWKRTISCWLKVLFTEERQTPFQNNTQCSFPTEDLTNFGTEQRNCAGKPKFNHKKLAEYYGTYVLVNHLTEGKNTSDQYRLYTEGYISETELWGD